MQIPKAIKISFILTWIFCVSTGGATAQFAGGSGTVEDPYQVEILEQLQLIADSVHLDNHFIQIADIDAGETIDWNEGKGFEPIGTATLNSIGFISSRNRNSFIGSYNGNGYIIAELIINRENEDCIGLFCSVEEANIKNIKLEDVRITGNIYTGGLSGYIRGGNISNVSVTGEIDGYRLVGGLAGYNDGQIDSSFTAANVTGENDEIGGLVGVNNSGGVIYDSHATGAVTGGAMVGGLVGNVWGGSISDSYAEGNVSGEHKIGGLIGYCSFGEIEYIHATGDVSGVRRVGGLIGHNSFWEPINDSYATGEVLGNVRVGGLIGQNDGTVMDSYATGAVSGDDRVGGFIGYNSSGGYYGNSSSAYISSSYATGTVSGNTRVGGLVGQNNIKGNIDSSFATGEVTGLDSETGGLVGENLWGRINNSYALGNVTGNIAVGGLAGINRDEGVITTSFSGGVVSGSEDVGGLIGINNATIESSYWDLESSEQDEGLGSGFPDGMTGLTTNEMTGIAAYENLTALDFEEIWLLTEGYPALNWEDVEALKIPTATGYEGQPVVFELWQNYPNPFNPMTRIRFDIPVESHVQLTIYNLLGQKVATLVNETRSRGRHVVPFDATSFSSGLYLYRIQADGFTESKQMLLVK